MSLEGKVAKLSAGGIFKGSVWLISQTHALTALHCVRGDDGFDYDELKLHFAGIKNPLCVEVEDRAEKLDIALLEIKSSVTGTLPEMVLSRQPPQINDNCLLHGHPKETIEQCSDAYSVKASLTEVMSRFKGSNGQLDCQVFKMGSLDVTPERGRSPLHGVSGGPMVLECEDPPAVLGVVIEELLEGNYVCVVSIAEIAEHIPVVAAALEASSHVCATDPRLFVSLSDDEEHVLWSAAVSPDEAARLWEHGPAGSGAIITELHCNSPLSDLGVAGRALVRLSAYAALKAGYVPDKQRWLERFNDLKEHHRAPDQWMDVSTPAQNNPMQGKIGAMSQPSVPPYPWVSLPKRDFARTIHRALNLFLLKQLNTQLYHCLEYGTDTDIGCIIEPGLRQSMTPHWEDWLTSLKTDPDLLQRFLVRVFSTDGCCEGDGSVLTSIGCTCNTKEQLFQATLFALALCAAGVDTTPVNRPKGNISVVQQTGHACGIKFSSSQRLDRIVAKLDWSTDVVILPNVQVPLLQRYEKEISMMRTEGCDGQALEKLPPLGIIGDAAFLDALEDGEQAVKDYYNARQLEMTELKAAMRVHGRTEALDV